MDFLYLQFRQEECNCLIWNLSWTVLLIPSLLQTVLWIYDDSENSGSLFYVFSKILHSEKGTFRIRVVQWAGSGKSNMVLFLLRDTEVLARAMVGIRNHQDVTIEIRKDCVWP